MKARLLTVLAHPDDESFGISATIARYVHEGVEAYHVCATRGEAGSSRPLNLSPGEFGLLRERELRRAGRVLGFKKIWVLGYPDSRLKDIAKEGPVAKIRGIMQQVDPQVVITFGHSGVTRHPDHVAVHHWVKEAIKGTHVNSLYYVALPPKALEKRGLPPMKEKITTIIQVGEYVHFKRWAIHCHHSQWNSVKRIFSFAGGANPISFEDYFILGYRSKGDHPREVEEDLFTLY